MKNKKIKNIVQHITQVVYTIKVRIVLLCMMKSKTVKLSNKGQIVIPKDMREDLGLSQGDDILLIAEGDVIILEKVRKENFRDLLKLSEKTLRKVWDNEEDEIWNEL